MAKFLSPLRYPGGKSKIYEKVKNLIIANSYEDRTYVEPFAGGFGIGLGLLIDGIVQSAVLNDYDAHIYHFWRAALYHTEALLKMIADTPITLEERERQKAIYVDSMYRDNELIDGFATLFLNRVNFSGVLSGGPIGGLSQKGPYKIDCRFNKIEISKRIEKIAYLGDSIELYNDDAKNLIATRLRPRMHTTFFNIDPPYVRNGHRLYANYFREEEHRSFKSVIEEHLDETQWIMTYDDCDLIRDIYQGYNMVQYNIQHNAVCSVQGKELVITNLPERVFYW